MQSTRDKSWLFNSNYENDLLIEDFADCIIITTKSKDVIDKKLSILYRYYAEHEKL